MFSSFSSAWNSRIPQTLYTEVPRELTEEHKNNRVGINPRLPEWYRSDRDSFLNRIITNDEE
jgi:hypothetical protein